MKKKIISIILIMALMGTMTYSIFAEETTTKQSGVTWEVWDASGVGSSFSYSASQSTGEYTYEEYIDVVAVNLYQGNKGGEEGTRELKVDAYYGADTSDVLSVQYYDKNESVWKDIDEFNGSYTLKNDTNRKIRFSFGADGIYVITYQFIALDKSVYTSCRPRYIIIKDGSYTIEKDPPKCDISGYKNTNTYPKTTGKIFAGWYTDKTYSTVYTENTGEACAKFIDENVLSVKSQQSYDNKAIRFVSTLDKIDYREAGFIINGTYGTKTITNKIKSVNSLYSVINAGGQSFEPNVFCSDSKYFFTYTVRGMDANIQSSWKIIPYFVTPDGTRVTGIEGEF